ncbi:MAG: HEAT repeat domain-containing protein, partial [Blastocatellia bacterium]
MEQKHILRIVVASPSDVKAERDLLPNVIEELNRGVAADRGLRFELSRWETDAYPGFHPEGPQGLIDPIIQITDCDLLIGIFWKKFGTPTADGQTGTEHEINLAISAWNEKRSPQVFVYFSQKPYSPQSKSEADQWGQVLGFREKFPAEGLWWGYNDEKHFEDIVRNHLINFVRGKFKLGSPAASRQDSTQSAVASRQDSAQSAPAQSIEDLLTAYRDQIRKKYGKITLLGETEIHELKRVFVELTINESYSRPTANSEWMGMWDAEFRKRYAPFGSRPDEERDAQRRIKPEDLLKRREPAVITGAPGCGKTTLMRWLALHVCDDDPKRIPIFVELKGLNQKSFESAVVSLESVLFDHAATESLKNPDATEAEREQLRDEFTRRLESGEVVALLDGLDEVREWEHFHHLCGAINRFVEDHGNNLMIISSRPFALRDRRFGKAEEMEIAPFNRDQIALFLDHYYGAEEGRKLLPKLMSPDLRDLVSVPTLIGAIVRRIHQSGKVETDRLKLYEGIVTDLAARIDSQKNVERFKLDDLDGRLKLAFLTQLAFDRLFDADIEHGRDAERVTFTTDFIEASARRFLSGDTRKAFTLAADVKATPMVREVAENVWSFSHLTLQEYLAARALAANSDYESVSVRACFHPLLVEMETLPMALGMVRNPDRVYETLEQLPESLDHKLLRLRARGLASAKIKPQTLQKMLRRLDDFITFAKPEERPYSDSVVRAFAQARGEARDAVALGVAARLDSANDSYVRWSAAEALRSIGSERAVDALLKALLQAQESPVRERAAEALGRIASERAVDALLKALLEDQDSSVRRHAAEALAS